MKLRKITVFAAAFILSAGLTAALPDIAGASENAYSVSAASSSSDFVIKTDFIGKKYVESYNGKGGDIKIPDGVDYIGETAFTGNTDITGVTFPKSCTEIKDYAFCRNSSIKYVTFEGNAKIGEMAFFYCSSLEKVTVKGSIKDSIGSGAFNCCFSLKTVKISKNQYRFIIDKYSFSNCKSLKSINIPSKCSEICEQAFLNCFDLQKITIPPKTKIGKESIGFAQLFEDDSFDDINQFLDNDQYNKHVKTFVPDGKKSWYDYSEMDYVNEKVIYNKVTPKFLTVTVVKGSPAEKYCRKNGVKYKYAKTT